MFKGVGWVGGGGEQGLKVFSALGRHLRSRAKFLNHKAPGLLGVRMSGLSGQLNDSAPAT